MLLVSDAVSKKSEAEPEGTRVGFNVVRNGGSMKRPFSFDNTCTNKDDAIQSRDSKGVCF